MKHMWRWGGAYYNSLTSFPITRNTPYSSAGCAPRCTPRQHRAMSFHIQPQVIDRLSVHMVLFSCSGRDLNLYESIQHFSSPEVPGWRNLLWRISLKKIGQFVCRPLFCFPYLNELADKNFHHSTTILSFKLYNFVTKSLLWISMTQSFELLNVKVENSTLNIIQPPWSFRLLSSVF